MADPTTTDAPDPRVFLRPLRTYWWLVILIVGVATAVTYFYVSSRPDRFQASTNVFLNTSRVEQVLSGTTAFGDDRTNETVAALVTSRTVARSAAERLGYSGDPGDLLADLEVIPATGADYITVTGRAGSGQRAAGLANAFAAAFVATRLEAAKKDAERARVSAERRLEELRDEGGNRTAVKSLEQRIQQLKVLESLPAGEAEQVDRARPPSEPYSPRPQRAALFAFAISLILALLLAYWLARFNRRLTRIEDFEAAYRMPVLAHIPHDRTGRSRKNDQNPAPYATEEAFRTLRSNLQLADVDHEISTLLVTSALPAEGKSTVVARLAMAYSEAGRRVAVVELDLRRPTLAQQFGLNRQPGLTEALVTSASIGSALQPVMASVPTAVVESTALHSNGAPDDVASEGTLAVLTSGAIPPNPSSILATQRVRNILRELSEEYDLVLIDSAPLLAVGDTLPLLTQVDAVLLVSRMGSATKDAAKKATETINRAPHVRVLGVAVNDVPEKQTGYSSYYGPE